MSTNGDVEDVEVIKTPIAQPQDDPPVAEPLKMSHMRSALVLSDPTTDGDHIGSSALADVAEDDWVELAPDDQGSGKVEIDEVEIENAGDKLEEGVQGPKDHIHD